MAKLGLNGKRKSLFLVFHQLVRTWANLTKRALQKVQQNSTNWMETVYQKRTNINIWMILMEDIGIKCERKTTNLLVKLLFFCFSEISFPGSSFKWLQVFLFSKFSGIFWNFLTVLGRLRVDEICWTLWVDLFEGLLLFGEFWGFVNLIRKVFLQIYWILFSKFNLLLLIEVLLI